MKILNSSEKKTFENLVSLKQENLKKIMSKFLKSKYDKVIETKDYLLAEGDIPIALTAHLDTVFDKPVKDLFYDTQKNVMWSPQGLGADDRAGVYSIMKIFQSGLKPHIIFTTDEEIGCLGAAELAKIDCPFKELNYIIELDRRGTNDCVFYDCDNPDFIDYVEDFGFIEAYGSYSDICEICPAWGVAGVNLSVGYKDEHSFEELLYVEAMLATIKKVSKMLSVNEIPYFEYIPSKYSYNWSQLFSSASAPYADPYYYDYPGYEEEYSMASKAHICEHCKKPYWDEDLIPVQKKDGTTCYYCPDCLFENVGWCNTCGTAFEIDPIDNNSTICFKCRQEYSPANNRNKHKKKKKKVNK